MSHAAPPTDFPRPHLASPAQPPVTGWLVPVLYERLSQALRLAEVAIVAGDAAGKSAALERASAVVFELLAAVDFQRGGELAPRLAALYGFFASELLVIGRTADREQLGRLIDMVTVLSGSWRNDDVMMSAKSQEALVD
jgi:flagellar protein FliS